MELYIERVMSIAILVIGLSHMIQRKIWSDFLNVATQHQFGALFIAIPTLAIGLFIVAGHNVWVWDVPVITTLLGWGYVVKSTIYLLWPNAVRNVMPRPERAGKTLLGVGLGMVLLGALMTWDAWISGAG